MAFWTQYWGKEWLDRPQGQEGQPLDHTAGNLFGSRGVARGDTVFVVTQRHGALYLIGSLVVGHICGRAEAARKLPYKPWPGKDHLLAVRGTGTPMQFDREVPPATVRALRLVGSDGREVPPKIGKGGLDAQTFRPVRQLTERSAGLLAALLARGAHDALADDDEAAFPEGRSAYRMHLQHERNAALVARKKRERRRSDPLLRCEACGFSFLEGYGKVGEGFVEAHHIVPRSTVRGATKTRLKDLALVCSNCHRMLHRTRPVRAWRNLKRLRVG